MPQISIIQIWGRSFNMLVTFVTSMLFMTILTIISCIIIYTFIRHIAEVASNSSPLLMAAGESSQGPRRHLHGSDRSYYCC